jgi:hypothetical protein
VSVDRKKVFTAVVNFILGKGGRGVMKWCLHSVSKGLFIFCVTTHCVFSLPKYNHDLQIYVSLSSSHT